MIQVRECLHINEPHLETSSSVWRGRGMGRTRHSAYRNTVQRCSVSVTMAPPAYLWGWELIPGHTDLGSNAHRRNQDEIKTDEQTTRKTNTWPQQNIKTNNTNTHGTTHWGTPPMVGPGIPEDTHMRRINDMYMIMTGIPQLEGDHMKLKTCIRRCKRVGRNTNAYVWCWL